MNKLALSIFSLVIFSQIGHAKTDVQSRLEKFVGTYSLISSNTDRINCSREVRIKKECNGLVLSSADNSVIKFCDMNTSSRHFEKTETPAVPVYSYNVLKVSLDPKKDIVTSKEVVYLIPMGKNGTYYDILHLENNKLAVTFKTEGTPVEDSLDICFYERQ